MGKIFKIKATRANDMVNVINSLSPQEMTKVDEAIPFVKGLRFATKLADEISEGNKEYGELMDKVQGLVAVIRDEELLKLEAAKQGDDEGKEQRVQDAVQHANAIINEALSKHSEELGVKAVAEKVVDITVNSDERFEYLKKLFEKHGVEKFVNAKALVEIFDAFDAATEA